MPVRGGCPSRAAAPGAIVDGMNTSRPHIAAAILLTLGGMVTAMAAAALVAAGVAVRSGILARPADSGLLGDLESLLPFIVAFIAVDLAAARGLVTGRAWAPLAASIVALGTVTMGVLGLLLLLLGNDPLSGGGAARGATEAIGIVTSFTGVYLSVLIALRLNDLPSRVPVAAAA